jgi:MFS family permease
VRVITRVLCAAGAAVAVLLAAVAVAIAPDAALGGLVLSGFVAVVAALAGRSVPPGGEQPVRRRAGPVAGAATLAGWLVMTGLLTLLGPLAWTLLLTAALAAAPAWWVRRRRGRAAASGRWAAATAAGPVRAAELSTPELCLAWRRSCRALLDAPDGPGWVELVRTRAALLDELERRDRDGFTRWLEAGPGAAADPGRYLATGG